MVIAFCPSGFSQRSVRRALDRQRGLEMLQGTFSPQTLHGRVALITGGGSGIGFGIAKAFVQVGAKVVLASRKVEVLENAVAELKAMGGDAVYVQADVRDAAQVQSAVQHAVEAFGSLD